MDLTNIRRTCLRIAGFVLLATLPTRAGEEEESYRRRSLDGALLPRLQFAELWDLDQSGDASVGDEVVLGLRRPLGPKRTVRLEDVPLAEPFDYWGDGATVSAAPGRSEIRVRLGQAPSLRLRDTYRPGARGATPSQVRTANGPVPILVRPSDRRVFAGDRFPDSPGLRPYYGQLHAHTRFSDGRLEPADAFATARQQGVDFFAVTDHLEQLTPERWEAGLEAARRARSAGSFVAFYGYEWGGYATWSGWMNHVNVIGTDDRMSVAGTLGLRRLYRGILALPGERVVAQFNHPGMNATLGRNNWNDFEYQADADLRLKLMMVVTDSNNDEDNREGTGYIPALDRGWHLAPEADEDNHTAAWAHTRKRTGLWIEELTPEAVLAGLLRMATFVTDDPDASLKLTADHEWLMGSTVYGGGPHLLELEVQHRTHPARVIRAEIVSLSGAVVAEHPGGVTPLRLSFEVDSSTDAYYFARVLLEKEDTRMISAPIFVDR